MVDRIESKEELDFLNDIENGNFEPISNVEKAIDEAKTAAKNTLRKNKKINIRLTDVDLDLLKQRAIHEGLPYQTLISSVLHKYATGQYD